MNAILSLIVAFVMIFSGVGELPAVPETANVYTLSDITISVGDESVTLDPVLRLTTAAGSERIDLGVELLSGENTLFPLKGRVEGDKVSFALSDSGKAYTLSEEALGDALQIEGIDEFMPILNKIVELCAMLPEIFEQQDEISAELHDSVIAVQIPDAEVEEVEIDHNGVILSGKTYTGNMSNDAMFAVLDVYLNAENETMRNCCQTLLDAFNMLFEALGVSETPMTGFGELMPNLIAAAEVEGMQLELTESETIPVEYTYAQQDGVRYQRSYSSYEKDGKLIDQDNVVYQDGDGYSLSYNIYEGDDDTYRSIACELQTAADGSFELIFDTSNGSSYEYTYTNGLDEHTEATYIDSYTSVSASCTVDEESGAREFLFAIDDTNSYSGITDGEVDYDNMTSAAISGAFGETIEEDGSVTTDVYLSYSGEDDAFYDISFRLNHAQVAYEDAFAGCEMMELTAEDLTGESTSAAMNQLKADVLGLAADLMTLTTDESVMTLLAMDVDQGYDDDYDVYAYDDGYFVTNGDFIDDYDDSGDYYAEYPETLDEAYAAYGNAVPEVAVPEGYVPANVSAFEGYMSIEYVNDAEEGFTLCVYPSYSDNETLFLKEDGSFAKIEGSIVNISYNEDGSVYVASIDTADSHVDLYFYSESIMLEDVQAMFAALA